MNSEYWKKRSEAILLANEKSLLEYEKELKRAYEATIRRIILELNAFYTKYAKDNNIDLATVRQRLNAQELKDFKEQANEYLTEVSRLGLDPKYKEYLRELSAKAYITKLQEIETNIRHELEKLNTEFTNGLGDKLKQGYEDSFYKTLFEVQKEAGFGVNFTGPSDTQLNKAIKTKWLGNNFSERIWTNKTALLLQLNQLIPQEFVRGRGPVAVAKDLSQKLNTSYNNAVRLARTEMNHISNQATMEAYKKSEVVKEYEYLATLDNRTSDICRELDGKVFKLSEAQPGINLPPMHPYCRSTTVPHFKPDEFDEPGDRIARDENGDNYLVGKDVTFKEWVSDHAEASYAKRIISPTKLKELSSKLYTAGKGHQQTVTQDLQDFTEGLNGTINYDVGNDKTSLDFSLKSLDSLTRKVTSKSVQEGLTLRQIEGDISDVLRYTLLSDNDSLVSDYFKLQQKLTAKGYTTIKVKNTLGDVNAVYRGLNTKVKTPDGYVFELQYHTPGSLDIKETNHKLYEISRLDETPQAEVFRLNNEMRQNSKSLTAPKDIDKIKNY